MRAALVFQTAERAVAVDGERDFFKAADRSRTCVNDIRSPALTIGITGVHPEQIARKQCRLFSADAAAYFDNDILLVIRIFRKEQERKLALEHFALASEGRQFAVQHRAQFFFVRLFEQQSIFFDIGENLFVCPKFGNDRLERRVLAIDFRKSGNIGNDRRIARHRFQFQKTILNRLQLVNQ